MYTPAKPAISSLVEHKPFYKKGPISLQKSTKVTLSILLGIFTVFFGIFAYFEQNAQAAASPWAQTDWSGGTSSGTVNQTVTTYESATNIETGTAGQIELTSGATATLKGNQLADGSTNFNVSAKNSLRFNTSQSYNDNAFSYNAGSPTRLTVDRDGDYFVSVTMPITSNEASGTWRNGVEIEIRVNGTKKEVGVGRSSYIRNASSHNESSSHLAVLLEDLTSGDYIEVYSSNTTSSTFNTLTGNFTLYAELIEDAETIFYATGTRTVASTDLNNSESAMQWTSAIKDTGYTHNNTINSHNISLDEVGNYFVTVNIPLGSSVQRANLIGRVELDGSLVDGGIFQQGYIRSIDNHFDSSIHYAGVVQSLSEDQVLNITVQQEAASGVVTTDSEQATIYIQKLPSTGLYFAQATQAGGSNDWNPGSAASINWATDNIIDSSIFTHSTSVDNHVITVDEDGDYLLAFNMAGSGGSARANNVISVNVNGSPITGAETKSNYRRQDSNHDRGSSALVIPLAGLSAGDEITLTTQLEAASGTINDDTPAILMLWRKGYAASGTLTSNIFDAEFNANWGNLTFSESGSGDVSIKVRSDSNSDMSGATDWSSCTGIDTSGTDISSNGCVTDGHRYLQYQVNLSPSGGTPVLEDISIAFSSTDSTNPTTNATSVALTGISDGAWTNTEPTITWTAGADNGGGSGLLGYCVALDEATIGASSSLDPASTAGALASIDDGVDLAHITCPYVATGTSLNLSSLSGLNLTSDRQYYFSIKAVDNAGNVWSGASNEFQDLVSFRYDGTNPTNVTFISTPSTSFGNIDDMFFSWPTSGGSAANDGESGIIGWQYSINGTSNWTGPDTEATLGIDYIEDDGSTSSHTLDEAVDTDVIVGNNTIYFRAVDAVGNFSTPVTGGVSYGGQAPTFIGGSVVTITPTTNTSNSFSVSWPTATANNGGSIETYYYMINTSPPSTLSTLTSNSTTYVPTTSTSISAAAITGAVRGSNTIYVVAVDDDDNYSPSNAISGSFTLNSSNPDPVQNLSATDASVKANELWRASLTWVEPSYKGTGELTYTIQRSTNNSTWADVATTTGTAYTDTVSSSSLFYYRIGTADSSDESQDDPTYSTSVSITPKGTFDEPPELSSDPEVTNITTQRATISWTTDRAGDTKISYGTSSGDYFEEEPSKSNQVTAHDIELTNLDPGTKYYYVAKWTDEDGNTGESEELTFETEPAPEVKDVNVSFIGINSATITFTAKNASVAKIYYGESTSFGGLSEIATSKAETTYSITLTGLTDGTKYFYKINTFDEEDEEYQGTTLDFTTLPRPRISEVRIQQVRGTAQPTVLITWNTNTEVSSIVTYYPDGNPGASIDDIDAALISGEHRMILRGLLPQTRYVLQVSGRDIAGNEAVSDSQTFTTATDTRPPLISNLKIEGSNVALSGGSSSAQQSQLIVSWDTDEVATSQVEYGEGTGTTYSQSTQEDSNLTFNHLVVISGLSPSKVYHLRAISKDDAGNITQSIDTVTITPKATDNALDLVISNLTEAFGFIGNLQ